MKNTIFKAKNIGLWTLFTMIFAYTSPALSSGIWDEMSEPSQSISVENLSVLNHSDLSPQIKIDILNLCINQAEYTDTFELRDSNLKISETIITISKLERIKQNCSGTLGESNCVSEAYTSEINNCASMILTKDRIKKGMSELQ
ncbi:MAG: hypothetical protein HOO06_15940 [Bdellovibrionaceae bacterium]|nr:hypothetical protein [Pseudobdellovibrionaceae bacterium]